MRWPRVATSRKFGTLDVRASYLLTSNYYGLTSFDSGIAADVENSRIREGIASTRIRCKCALNKPSFHPCEYCLRPNVCHALRRPPPELSTKRFCAACYQSACQLLSQKQKKITSSRLFQRVKGIVCDDLKQIYGPTGYRAHWELLKSRVNDIWNELKGQALEEGNVTYAWKDSYVVDICGDSAQGKWESHDPYSRC